MRKLVLSNYMAKSKVPDQAKIGNLLDIEYPYPVKDSILTLLFSRELKLTGAELVRQQALALKIEACKEDEILLEDAEWQRLKHAVETCTGFNRQDIELVTRVLEAPVVEVGEKPKN